MNYIFLTAISCFAFTAPALQAIELPDNPIELASSWFDEEGKQNPDAKHIFGSLATVKKGAKPSNRIVSVFMSDEGPVFYTHQKSHKVRHMKNNRSAAMNVWLATTGRQITIEGEVAELSREQRERAWSRMPREFQLKFLASRHDGTPATKAAIQSRYVELQRQHSGKAPMPEEFIGYIIQPDELTFHDLNRGSLAERVSTKLKGKKWQSQRLDP